MHLKINALVLFLLLVTTPAVAGWGKVASGAAKSRGNLLALAVQVALLATDAILDEGRKPVRRTATPHATDATTAADTASTTLSPSQSYPFEYVIGNQSFASVEVAHQYAITHLLTQRGFKRSRRSDGLYYDRVQVFLGSYYGQSSSIGYFISDVQATSSPCSNNVCGSIQSFHGSIYYKGTLSEKDVTVSDNYKSAVAAELARQFETLSDAELQAIIDGVKAQPNAQADAKADAQADAQVKPKADVDAKADAKADEATKDKAKPREEQKPFELPEFCTFARPVCGFIDWVKQEPDFNDEKKSIPKAQMSDLGLNDSIEKRVDFTGSCPTKQMSFTLRGQVIQEAIPMHHFCNLLEKIAPWLVAFTYLGSAFFIVRTI